MDEINLRFKEMRKILNLSQKSLGDSLGLSSSGISNIENGTRNVTDKHVKLLNATFGIRENWLRTGEEPMLVQSDASLIEELATEYKMSEKQKKIMATFAAMDDKKREVLAEAFFEFVDALASSPEISATIAARPADDDRRLTRAEKEAIMKRQLDAEETAAMSTASTGTNGMAG